MVDPVGDKVTAYADASKKLLSFAVTKLSGDLEYISLPVESLEEPMDIWRARSADRDHIADLKRSLIENPTAGMMLEPLHAVLESAQVTPKVRFHSLIIIINIHAVPPR